MTKIHTIVVSFVSVCVCVRVSNGMFCVIAFPSKWIDCSFSCFNHQPPQYIPSNILRYFSGGYFYISLDSLYFAHLSIRLVSE